MQLLFCSYNQGVKPFFCVFTGHWLLSHPNGNTLWRGRYGSCSHEPTAIPQRINVWRVLRWRLWWHRANSACMQRLNGSMHATIRNLYRYMICMSTCNYLWDGTWQSSLLRRVECILTCWVSLTRDAVALCATAQMRYVNLDHVKAPGDWNRWAWKKATWILTNPRCEGRNASHWKCTFALFGRH